LTTVAYCQLTYPGDVGLTTLRIKEADGAVDSIIIAAHDCTPEQIQQMVDASPLVTVKTFDWTDNFPAARNEYLEVAKQQGMDWIVVSDPDEAFNEEFFKLLKPKILPKLEEGGWNMAGINCHEQFEAIEWMDDLEKLKESPGGYRESDFYKMLLFRIYPDTAYQGIGTMGNVHETWGSQTVPFKPVNLQKTVWYTHKKSALQIWRNACRNFTIGGGGNNIGAANPMWVEWRRIMDMLHLKGWNDVEQFVAFGPWADNRMANMIELVLPWVIKALTFSASDYGTETREAAKYIIYYNEWMRNVPEVKSGLANPPKRTQEEDVRAFVMSAYFQALGRHPDQAGLDNYTQLIMEGKVRPQDLVGILKTSPEHDAKFKEQPSTLGPPSMGAKRGEGEVERIRINLPINVDVQLTEDLLVQTLMQSRTYTDKIKPRLDIGKFIESIVDDPAEFYNEFYKAYNKGGMGFKELLDLLVWGKVKESESDEYAGGE